MRLVTAVVLPFSRIGTETSRVVHVPVLRAVFTAAEGKTCANRQRFFLRLFLQADLSYRFWIKVNNFQGLFESLPHHVATTKLSYIKIYP